MKNLLITLIMVLTLSPATLWGQAPEAFKYQAIARDASGNVLANKSVSFRISLLQGTVTGAIVYKERHYSSTNEFGLVNLEIGKGTVDTGTFSAIEWAADEYFVKVEMDPAGGEVYQIMGVSQLVSVPYALHAKTVTTGDNWGNQVNVTDGTLSGSGTVVSPLKISQQAATAGQVLKWNGTTWLPASDSAGSPVALPFEGSANTTEAALKINNTGTGNGIHGNATTGAGIYGSAQLTGVYGISSTETGEGRGVYGASVSSSGVGIFGYAGSANGITRGVKGIAMSEDGTGVYGEAPYIGVEGFSSLAAGPGYGVLGSSPSTNGRGVMGMATASSGITYGLYGSVNSPNGYSGYFQGGSFFISGNTGIARDPVAGSGALQIEGNAQSAIGAHNTSSEATLLLTNEGNGSAAHLSTLNSQAMYVRNNSPAHFAAYLTNAGTGPGLGVDVGDDYAIYGSSNSNEKATIYLWNRGTAPAAELHGRMRLIDGTEGAGKVLTSDANGLASWQAQTPGLWMKNGTSIYYNDGKVGIGTSSPAQLLSLNAANAPAVVQLTNTATGTTAGDGAFIGIDYPTPNLSLWNTENTGIHLATNNQLRATITETGNLSLTQNLLMVAGKRIGIGVSNPVFSIEMNSNAPNTKAKWFSSLTGTTENDGLTVGVTSNTAEMIYHEDGPLNFGTNGTTRMAIQSDGQVGIGTSVPTAQLHIASNSSSAYPHILLTENDSDHARLMFRNTDAALKDWTIAGLTAAQDEDSRLDIRYSSGLSIGKDIITITGDGEVQHDRTGDAHILPIAYGHVNASGTIASGTGNFTSAWNGADNRYEITITDETYHYTDYTTIVTPGNDDPVLATTASVSGKLLVYVFDLTGTKVQRNFGFVVYKK